MNGPAPGPPARRWATFAAKSVLAAAILALLLASGWLEPARLRGAAARWPFLALALGVMALRQLLMFLRWWLLLRAQGLSAPLFLVLRAYWTSLFLGTALPGTAGMDLVRSYLVFRDYPGTRTRALSTVVTDRTVGLMGLFALGAGTGLALRRVVAASPALLSIWTFTAALLVLSALVLFGLGARAAGSALARVPLPRLRERLVRLHGAFAENLKHPRTLAATFLLSVVANAIGVVVLVLCSRALGLAADLSRALFAVPLALAANALPVTPGGLGVGEGAAQAVYRALGYDAGAESMLLFRAVLLVNSLPGLFFFLAGRRRSAAGGTRNDASESLNAPDRDVPLPGEVPRPAAGGSTASRPGG